MRALITVSLPLSFTSFSFLSLKYIMSADAQILIAITILIFNLLLFMVLGISHGIGAFVFLYNLCSAIILLVSFDFWTYYNKTE